MGCNVHLHIEVKINNEWHHHSESYPDRNYKVFAKMGNIRNSFVIEPLSDNRGVPEDATFFTKVFEKSSGYTLKGHSYLNLIEIAILHDWIRREVGLDYLDCIPYVNGNWIDSLYDSTDNYKDIGVTDARYIFWFDN